MSAHHNKAPPVKVKVIGINSLDALLKNLLYTGLILSASHAAAEVYIYQGPGGERVVSDRPIAGYTRLTRRDTLSQSGHILADRPLNEGGPADFKAHIRTASDKYMVDPALIEAIIMVESSFRVDAVSSSGATGLMQLMPGTARDLEVRDRYDARQNIHGGVRYIAELMERFEGNLTLVIAAYNAGPNAVARHNGIPPDKPETTRYVAKVMAAYAEYRHIRYGGTE